MDLENDLMTWLLEVAQRWQGNKFLFSVTIRVEENCCWRNTLI